MLLDSISSIKFRTKKKPKKNTHCSKYSSTMFLNDKNKTKPSLLECLILHVDEKCPPSLKRNSKTYKIPSSGPTTSIFKKSKKMLWNTSSKWNHNTMKSTKRQYRSNSFKQLTNQVLSISKESYCQTIQKCKNLTFLSTL